MLKQQQVTRVRKKEKPRGFGSVIAKNLALVEKNPDFYEVYSNLKLTVFLNATDTKWATLVKIKNGKIDIETMRNDDKRKLTKKALKWDGKIEAKLSILLGLTTGDLSIMASAMKILSGKLKVSGMKNVYLFQEIFELAPLNGEEPESKRGFLSQSILRASVTTLLCVLFISGLGFLMIPDVIQVYPSVDINDIFATLQNFLTPTIFVDLIVTGAIMGLLISYSSYFWMRIDVRTHVVPRLNLKNSSKYFRKLKNIAFQSIRNAILTPMLLVGFFTVIAYIFNIEELSKVDYLIFKVVLYGITSFILAIICRYTEYERLSYL